MNDQDKSHSSLDSPDQEHTSNTVSLSHSLEGIGGALTISPYTEALVKVYTHPPVPASTPPTRISVSQTVSFMAFLYEKMRNAVEFREEHLVRRASIERILKRRMILNENGRDIAEPLIRELLWARYYENNTIGENKISEVQSIIDKYFFLRNEIGKGRGRKEQETIGEFMLQCLSCEIQDDLSSDVKKETFVNYVYQIMRPQISSKNFESDEERDIQTYIAVEKTFAHSDISIIKYHLLKIMIPEITQISWQESETVLPRLYDIFTTIESQIHHPIAEKTKNVVKKHVAPFLVLKDIFEQNKGEIGTILSDEAKLKYRVDQACRKRYEESGSKLRRMGIRSFIYILLTKVVFAVLIEVPYDLYIAREFRLVPLLINIIFPPALMAIIIFTVSVPGDDNTRRIFQLLRSIITLNPDNPDLSRSALVVGKVSKAKGMASSFVFSLLYLFMYIFTFGSIVYVLSKLNFSPVSQTIFIFFVTLVTFFSFRIIQITQEFRVVEQDTFLGSILDFFFLPIIRVGQWLSGEVLSKFNVFIFVFDFIIEMPFKAIVEIFDEWIRFVRVKKDEMI